MTDPAIADPIVFLTGALSAGAATVAKTVCQEAVKDAYSHLKSRIRNLFPEKEKPKLEMILAEYEKEPEEWAAPMKKALSETKSDRSEEVIEAARALLEALKSTSEGRDTLSRMNFTNCRIGNVITGDNATIEGGVHFGSTK